MGKVLGVRAFEPGDLVFIDPQTPRVVDEQQPYRERGFVTVVYQGQHCTAWHHGYPSDLAFPDDKSLWSQHQLQAAEWARPA